MSLGGLASLCRQVNALPPSNICRLLSTVPVIQEIHAAVGARRWSRSAGPPSGRPWEGGALPYGAKFMRRTRFWKRGAERQESRPVLGRGKQPSRPPTLLHWSEVAVEPGQGLLDELVSGKEMICIVESLFFLFLRRSQ